MPTNRPQIKALANAISLDSMLIEKANAKAFDEMTKENLTHSEGDMLIQIRLNNILGIINNESGNSLHIRK